MAAQGAEHVKMQDKGIAFCADRYNHVNDAVVLYQVIVLKREHVFSVGKTSDCQITHLGRFGGPAGPPK